MMVMEISQTSGGNIWSWLITFLLFRILYYFPPSIYILYFGTSFTLLHVIKLDYNCNVGPDGQKLGKFELICKSFGFVWSKITDPDGLG